MRAATADVIAWQDHGDHAARARAVQSVEDMVRYHARRTHRRVGRFGVDLEDLVGAGWEGALIATDRLDRARGEYAAVAALYIRSHVEEAARRQSGVVAYGTGNRLRALEVAVNRALGEADTAGLTQNQALAYAANATGIDAVEATAIARRSHAVSFDPAKHDSGSSDADEDRHAAAVTALVEDCLNDLTQREADVIRRNIMGDETLRELGAEYGVSGQAMKVSKDRALEKLGAELRRRRLTAEDLL